MREMFLAAGIKRHGLLYGGCAVIGLSTEQIVCDPGICALDLSSLVDDLGVLFQPTALIECDKCGHGIATLAVQFLKFSPFSLSEWT
jgi:hypothetical protein